MGNQTDTTNYPSAARYQQAHQLRLTLNGNSSNVRLRTLPPSVEDLQAQLDAMRPEELLHAFDKGEAITGTFKCDRHGAFERKGCRIGPWFVWRGAPECYGSGWTGDSGCQACCRDSEALSADHPEWPSFWRLELKAAALCSRHGEVLVEVHVEGCNDQADFYVGDDLCPACEADWGYECWLQEQLGLSQEQWDLPGVGNQIMDAICRAEQASKV